MAPYRLIEPLKKLSLFLVPVILLSLWLMHTNLAMGQPGYDLSYSTCNSKTICWMTGQVCWGTGNCETNGQNLWVCPRGPGKGKAFMTAKRTATYPWGVCQGSATGALCTSGTVFCAHFNMYASQADCNANANIQCFGYVLRTEACYDP
jgi:hypothetical protein